MKMLAELNSLTPDAVDALTQALRDHADALREATRVTRAKQAEMNMLGNEYASRRAMGLNDANFNEGKFVSDTGDAWRRQQGSMVQPQSTGPQLAPGGGSGMVSVVPPDLEPVE